MGLVLAIVTFLLPEFWIERLGAETIDGREEAERWLKRLGWASMPALLAAERHPDPEIAERVRMLLGSIPLGDRLSPELRQAIPGIEDRLAGGKDEIWLELFLAASKLPQIPTRDLEFLLEPAYRAAKDPVDRFEIVKFLLKARIQWTMRLFGEYLSKGERTAWDSVDQLPLRLKLDAFTWMSEPEGDPFHRTIGETPLMDLIRAALPIAKRDRTRPGVREVLSMIAVVRAKDIETLLQSGTRADRLAAVAFVEEGATWPIDVLLPRIFDADPVVRMAVLAAVTRIANRPR